MSFSSRSSFKKKHSYSLNIKNETREHKLGRFSSSSSSNSSKNKKTGRDNLGFASGSDPKLTEFVFEGWNGLKNRSRDVAKGWTIDDHRVPPEILYLRYGTHPDRGLTQEQAKKSLEFYGPNVLFPPKRKSEFMKFLNDILMGLNLLLWISGGFSILTFLAEYFSADLETEVDYDNLTSGIALIIVVLVAGCFSYYQEYKSMKIIDSFRNLIPQFASVWRDGRRQEIEVGKIVVGDVVEVKYGDRIPADLRILESIGFKVDNSTLTGEAEPQKRSKFFTDKDPLETQNLAFFSTSALEGTAKGLVIRVGNETFMGKLASIASEMKATSTPLAKEMRRIIIIMTSVSLSFGIIFFGIGLSMDYNLIDTLFFVIGIVVANLPENLNISVTIILGLTAKKLADKCCLVKHLQAVETLGSASVICSDKTGTITQNKMCVAHLWFSDDIAEADTSEFAKTGLKYHSDDSGFQSLGIVAILCSRARFKSGQEDTPVVRKQIEGDASEAAILRFAELQFGQVTEYRDKFPKVCEIPFNSRNKFQVSIHDLKEKHDPRYLLVMKGAPEKIMVIIVILLQKKPEQRKEVPVVQLQVLYEDIVFLLSHCSTILNGTEEYELDDAWRAKIEQVYSKLGALGERVLGFCDWRLPIDKYPPGHAFDSDKPDFLKPGFRFVGLISMIDPPRATVPLAVSKCRAAGVKVVMITGDHPITAKAIARAVGIISQENMTIEEIAEERYVYIDRVDPRMSKSAVIKGTELAFMTQDEIEGIVQSYEELVFARTSPEQKYMIVEAFQRLGHVVAVTGDGVNDAPALKKADIGISMGLSGTDVAKEVSDLVLMDDNFATILNGVEEGRLIFDNLKKLIRYLFADNVAEMYCYWIFIILKVPLPMGTLAMLLSTLAIDLGPAASLAHEGPESDIMKLKPRCPKSDSLITAQVLSYSYGQISVIETAAGFFAYFVTLGYNGWLPLDLLYIQSTWESPAINDLEDSYGQEWAFFSRQRLKVEAQTAFFAALVICQWFNALACKTRRLSLFQQGLGNHFMNVALILSPMIACFLIYTPGLNNSIYFIPLKWESWVACLPFGILLFVYDELRRFGVRTWTNGWIHQEFNI